MGQGGQDQRLPAGLGLPWTFLALILLAGLNISAWLSPVLAADNSVQNFPARPVKLIVNFPAGSGTADTVARALGEFLTRKWGQPVTVDNIPGSTGVVGAEAAFRAEPDGYTLLVTPAGALTIAQHLQKVSYDPAQFVPVSMLETSPIVLVASPQTPFKNVKELIAYARANPGKLSVATHGDGSSSHLAAEWLRSAAQLQGFKIVPFRGSVAALQGLGDGRVDILFDNLGSSLQPIRSGQVKALAVASDKPEALLPGVPAIAEALPGFVTSSWVAVMAPPKTPPNLVNWLSEEFANALRQPQIVQTLNELACEPVGSTPEATGAFIRNESERWKSVIRDAKMGI
jgi:tripartite-type tricarboxylate transporter receptor subunit TctC